MIDESGLTNLIVVVQACYSGSFVDNLAAPDRMVITAAAADRTSFGCASENSGLNSAAPISTRRCATPAISALPSTRQRRRSYGAKRTKG